ncbi:MAG: dimethyl sulfoxide reductase anchor subunit [Coriobacteriales bacterium]|jgi:anaerobic dimethyl sulfoxide reductase subunit C (anchor subunit)|nr:dimethyl sulfoxide reductase anchor subunit [Coriobacteriales bacterium]
MQIEWALVLFTAVSGIGAWLFVADVLGRLLKTRNEASCIEPIVALVLTIVGGLLSVLHLAHPERIIEALNRPTSGIFIEACLIGLLALIIVVYLVLMVRKASDAAQKAIGVIGIVVAVVLSFMCGESYVMAARPAWNNIALPLSYAGTAAAAGAATNLLIKAIRKVQGDELRFNGYCAIVGAGLGLITALVFCLFGADSLSQTQSLTTGWIVTLFAGLVVSCACSAIAIKKANLSAILAALTCVGALAGAISVRCVMWLIGAGTLDFFNML